MLTFNEDLSPQSKKNPLVGECHVSSVVTQASDTSCECTKRKLSIRNLLCPSSSVSGQPDQGVCLSQSSVDGKRHHDYGNFNWN